MDPEHGVVHNVPLEIRESDEGEHLVGVVVQEGRAGTARQELFAPQSLIWPAEGIPVRTTHLQGEVGRAIPTRHSGGEIRIRLKATPAIRSAYESGKRFLSAQSSSPSEKVERAVGEPSERSSPRCWRAPRWSARPGVRGKPPLRSGRSRSAGCPSGFDNRSRDRRRARAKPSPAVA